MPAILTLSFLTPIEDPEALQEAVEEMQTRAEQGVELEESFQGETGNVEVLGATWILFEV